MTAAPSRGSQTAALVGALGAAGVAEVDGRGVVAPRRRPFEVACWIGAEDGWRCGRDGEVPRQRRVGAYPVVETILRVPGGEAVQRVWGVGDGGGFIAVEVENRSAAAFAVAFVLRPAGGKECRTIDLRDEIVLVDGRPAIALPRMPRAWAVARAGLGAMRSAVTGGETSEGAFRSYRDRRGVEAAFVFPVPHRTSVRAAVVLDAADTRSRIDPSTIPDAEAASRGWKAHLERGTRTEMPDEALQLAVDASRVSLLLEASASRRPDATVVAGLEDWGFDAEAAIAWRRLGSRARRVASRRDRPATDPWRTVSTYLAVASPAVTFPGGPAPFLRAVRDLIVCEVEGRVDLMPGFPPEWLGRDLAAHGVPTRGGTVSFAIRWHGERPALLWEAPAGTAITASRLDPGWSAPGPVGETLLARPPASFDRSSHVQETSGAPEAPA